MRDILLMELSSHARYHASRKALREKLLSPPALADHAALAAGDSLDINRDGLLTVELSRPGIQCSVEYRNVGGVVWPAFIIMPTYLSGISV